MTATGEDAFAEKPIGSGAFTMEEWRRGDKVVLKKNPNFWQADQVSLDGVEWISVPDDNTRMLKVQAGELDAAIFVPFAKVAELEKDPNLIMHKDPSTREDHLLINHSHPPLDKLEVRQAIDFAIDKKVDRRHRDLRHRHASPTPTSRRARCTTIADNGCSGPMIRRRRRSCWQKAGAERDRADLPRRRPATRWTSRWPC